MPVNQTLSSSTSLLFAPAAPSSQPAATLSEKSYLIDFATWAAQARSAAQPARVYNRPSWNDQLSANAHSVLSLRPGWDGPGSIAISATLLSRAMFYVESAIKANATSDAAPRLVPGGDGSIQIEWHTRRGELEFDLDTDGAMSIWIRNHASGAEFDGEGEEALSLFYRWAPWISSRLHDAPHAPTAAQMAFLEVAA